MLTHVAKNWRTELVLPTPKARDESRTYTSKDVNPFLKIHSICLWTMSWQGPPNGVIIGVACGVPSPPRTHFRKPREQEARLAWEMGMSPHLPARYSEAGALLCLPASKACPVQAQLPCRSSEKPPATVALMALRETPKHQLPKSSVQRIWA